MSGVAYKKSTLSCGALALLALLGLAGCKERLYDASAFYDRGSPEALLDVSSEVVNLGVANKGELRALSNWIANDQPTRAELFCDAILKSCKDAQNLLQRKGVEVSFSPSPENTVTLIYERILARDCNARYITKGTSYYNEPSPSFGCAMSANIVQHVSNKRDFISPNLSDDPSARGGVAAYKKAFKPSSSGGGDSLLKAK